MRPAIPTALRTLAGTLVGRVAAEIADDYARSSVELTAVLLLFAATDAEHAAEIRSAENRELRALFARAASTIGDATLRDRVETASRSADASLSIADLDAANDELRRVLIELHAHAEDAGLAALDREIWSLLRRFAETRALPPLFL